MGDDKSSPDGLLLVGTILLWWYALDWLGYCFPRTQRLIRPDALPEDPAYLPPLQPRLHLLGHGATRGAVALPSGSLGHMARGRGD